jgi:hypothetical protein
VVLQVWWAGRQPSALLLCCLSLCRYGVRIVVVVVVVVCSEFGGFGVAKAVQCVWLVPSHVFEVGSGSSHPFRPTPTLASASQRACVL